jgi:Calx-beta domain
MSATRRHRRVLTAVAATIALPVAALVAPAAAHAGGGSSDEVITADGTICWEEGGASEKRNSVTVRLSRVAKDSISVVLDTADGSATAPDDYKAISGLKVIIPGGVKSVQVPLDIVADGKAEQDEYFSVFLSNPSEGKIGENPAKVIIKDGPAPK